jgi:hypothetical protein
MSRPSLRFPLGTALFCACTAMLSMAGTASAASGPPAAARALQLAPGESRDGLLYFKPVSVDVAAVRAASRSGSALVLADPDGGELRFQRISATEHANGLVTWIGRAEGAPVGQEAVLTVGPGGAFGRIPRPDGSLLQLETVGGRTRLMEDQAALLGQSSEPRLADPLRPPVAELRDAEARLGKLLDDAVRTRAANGGTDPTDPVIQADPGDIDVLLAYSGGLAAYLGSDEITRAALQNRIDIGNQALANAGLAARFRLVATERVDFTDNGSNGDALDLITYWRRSDAPAVALRLATLRHRHGADIVGLVRRFLKDESVSCGNGWLGGYQGSNIAFSVDFGYFTANIGNDGGSFCSDRTIAHEIGHNLGQNHDIDTNEGDRDGAHSYSHGYRLTPEGQNGFYTVMAYRNGSQAPVNTFSNPDVVRSDCANQACGTAEANVALSLSQTMPVAAQWLRAPDSDDRHIATSRGHLDLTLSGLPALTNARWRAEFSGGGDIIVTGPTTAAAGATLNARLVWDALPATTAASIPVRVVVESSPGVVAGFRDLTLRRRDFIPEARVLADNVAATVAVPASTRSLSDDRFTDEGRLYFTVPPHATEFRVRVSSAGDVDVYAAPVAATDPGSALIGPGNARRSPQVFDSGPGFTKELVIPVSQSTATRWMIALVRPGTSNPVYQTATVTARVSAQTTAPAFRSGQYYNPDRSGHGVFVDFAGDQWVAVWYTYLQDGTPVWYYSQAAAPGANGLWSAPLYRVGWNGSATTSTVVGDMVVTPVNDTSMVFSYNVDGESGSEPMVRLGGGGCPSSQSLPLDATGHWYSPSLSGFGYSAQYEPNQEIYLPYVYDSQGMPRWLIGAKDWDEATTSVPLEQLSGFCALCGHQPTVSRLTGTLTRQIGLNGDGERGLTQVGVNAPLLAPLAGTWVQSRPTALLSARKDCQ